MAALISNQGTNSDRSLDSYRKKRRKIESSESSEGYTPENRLIGKWRSSSVERIYAVKLVRALQRAQEPNSTEAFGVRNVADRVLAMAAKGTTRWSRAILANRLRKHRKVKHPNRLKKIPLPVVERLRRRKLPSVEKKVRILSRLIPGGRRLPAMNLLEETGDYIAAIEMQVRAMTALAELLAGGQSDQLESASSS